MTKSFIDQEFITVERCLLGDKITLRWRQIRAISGCPDAQTPPGQIPTMIDGACTIYMEGDLGFAVNHTHEEVMEMIRQKEVVH